MFDWLVHRPPKIMKFSKWAKLGWSKLSRLLQRTAFLVCFHKGHLASSCTLSNYSCSKCKEKHNISICIESKNPNYRNNSGSSRQSKTASVDEIIRVKSNEPVALISHFGWVLNGNYKVKKKEKLKNTYTFFVDNESFCKYEPFNDNSLEMKNCFSDIYPNGMKEISGKYFWFLQAEFKGIVMQII